jgi:uncharacterized protein YcbK (DUF882 family)
MNRQPLSPAEFDAVCRELERSCPWLWQTSGYRSAEHNAEVGGHVMSKHLLGMARDYGAKDQVGLEQAADVARGLNLWIKVHDVGSGDHIHTQGLPTGPVAPWWLLKYT